MECQKVKDGDAVSGGISLATCQFSEKSNGKKLRTGCCFRWYLAIYLSILGEIECQKVKDGILLQVVFRYLLVIFGEMKVKNRMLFSGGISISACMEFQKS